MAEVEPSIAARLRGCKTTTVRLTEKDLATLLYAQLDQIATQASIVEEQAGAARDAQERDLEDVRCAIRLLREDLDAFDALLDTGPEEKR